MHDACGMDRGEGLRGPGGEGEQGAAGQWAMSGQVLREGGARGVGGGEPRGFGIGVRCQKRQQKRALDAGGWPDFSDERGVSG